MFKFLKKKQPSTKQTLEEFKKQRQDIKDIETFFTNRRFLIDKLVRLTHIFNNLQRGDGYAQGQFKVQGSTCISYFYSPLDKEELNCVITALLEYYFNELKKLFEDYNIEFNVKENMSVEA